MTVIIAEAGENHCGEMDKARQLIELAAGSGADYVKFQLYNASRVADDDPEKEWFGHVQVSDDQWFELVEHAREVGIAPLATPWDCEKAEAIFKAGVDTVKIASFHTVDLELLEFVNARAARVFLSTGMGSLKEVERAVAALNHVEELYVLHCVSEYPLPPENVNLKVMDTLRDRFGPRARIGYSDHTIGILAPVAAVARGAEVIEKHITLDKSLEGTDHLLSADPEELPEMVRQIRLVEMMLGQPEKRLTKGESELQTFMRERFHH